MAQKSLLQMLEEVASKLRSLEREKREAVTKIQALEREVGELVSLITLAGEKVDEILNVGANDETSPPQAVNVPKQAQRMGEFSADPQKQPKRLLPHTFIPD